MIRKVTDAMLSVASEGLRPITWVAIEDVESLTTDELLNQLESIAVA
jgi:phenylpyruvate tautomerase PptA (4-oxalocrotonate tautomerase family)